LGGIAFSPNGSETAINNNITLSGNTIISQELGGGFASYRHGDDFTGNTLNVVKPNPAGGITVGNDVFNFENYNFLFQNNAPSGAIGLDVGGLIYLTNNFITGAGDVRSRISAVNLEGGDNTLPVGHQFILFKGTLDLGTPPFNQSAARGNQGVTLIYDYDLDINAGTGLTATVTSVSINPKTKALSESFLSGLALLTQGSDLLMDKAVKLAAQNSLDSGLQAFGVFGGGKIRNNTGSHVDVNGFSLLTGLAHGTELSPGRFTFGGFFEYGTGDYDSYNSFAHGSVYGSGDTDYVGGGLLARLDFSSGFYAEASGRLGNIESEFSSNDMKVLSGKVASYETSSAYYGFHLGAGYLWNITDQSQLDL
jgi:hypothetical protein